MDSPFKRSPAEPIQFRLLCPVGRTGAIIGKGGSVIRHLQSVTSARIRVLDDPSLSCDERVVLIVSDSSTRPSNTNRSCGSSSNSAENPSVEQKPDSGNDCTESNANADCESEEKPLSSGQKAVVKVLERIVIGDDVGSEGDEVAKRESETVCRMLVGGNQVGCVLGRGGRVVETIRQESGANVRLLPKDQIPVCAFPGDELIQMSGNFSAVKKALVFVSSCLQDNHRADTANSGVAKHPGPMPLGNAMHTQVDPFPQWGYASGHHPADYHPRGYPSNQGPENIGVPNRVVMEEEIVFKLLCQVEKVGSLIGKGGSIIRALQNETGASIKVADAASDSDERIVVISARENSEQRHSPVQDAVIRVHSRIAEIGFEPGAAVVARLLIHSQQIGCLLGKGGHIISEMRRTTGASIRVFPKELSLKCGSQNDEVVQVIGSLQSVQDALFQITGRLREAVFPMKPPFPGGSGPPFLPPFPELPPPPFRPRHYPGSPGAYPSPVGSFHGIDHSPVPSQPHDHHFAFSHGMDRMGPSNFDRIPYPYGGERPGQGPPFDRPSSPRSWGQAVTDTNARIIADDSFGFARSGLMGSENQAPVLTSSTVEVVIPQAYFSHVYGEDNSNLRQIMQISGANVVVHDPKSGATEGVVVVSGTSDQARVAQTLIHAFILCGQA